MPIYKYTYQTLISDFRYREAQRENRFKPNQEGIYILTLEARDAAGNSSTYSITVRAVTPGTQPNGIDGAPVVDEIVPADGSKDIMATMVISVAFNEPVNPDTVNYNTLQLMDLGPIDPVSLISSPTFTPVQVSANVVTSLENGVVLAKIQPSSNLIFGRQYQIRVTRQITDSVPNSAASCDAQNPPQADGCLLSLDKEYIASFTTKVPQGYTLLGVDQFKASVGDVALYSSGTGSTYAYITAQDEGWRVVDVTNPAVPFVTYQQKMSNSTLSWKYRGVAVNQQTGILAMTEWIQWNYSGGSMFGYVRFYDVAANPANPPKIGQERLAEAFSGVPSDVAMDGNYAYVSTVMVGVQVVDVELSRNMSDEIGTAVVGVLDTVNLDQCPVPGSTGSSKCSSPHDIVVYRPGKALLTTFSGHLLTLDMSNPQLPQPMNFFYPASAAATFYYNGAWTVGAVADYSYVDTNGNDQVKDLAITVGRYPSGKVHVLDITDPFNPAVMSVVRDTQSGIFTVFANEVTINKASGLVYITDNMAVYIIDIKNPNDPRVLNVISQAPSGGAMLPLGSSYGIVEKDGWLYLANYDTGLKTVDLHPPVYVALNTADIIIGEDGYPREDNSITYSVIAPNAVPVQNAYITIFKDDFPVATLVATAGMQGSAILPSTFNFDMNSNYKAQAVLNTSIGGQARSQQVELGLTQPYIMFVKCNSPCESCLENLVYGNGSNYTTIKAQVRKKGKSVDFTKMSVEIETDFGLLRATGTQPDKKISGVLSTEGVYSFDYISETNDVKSALKATVRKKGAFYSLLPPYANYVDEIYNYKYYNFNSIITDSQYDSPYQNLNSQQGIENWLSVSHTNSGAISSLYNRGIGQIDSNQLIIPVDAGDAINSVLPASGVIRIENELISFASKTMLDGYKPALVATSRGVNGTTAAAHGDITANTNIPAYLQTSLASSITATTTQITVASTSGAKQRGILYIGAEAVTYNGKTDVSFLNCVRSKKAAPYRTRGTCLF